MELIFEKGKEKVEAKISKSVHYVCKYGLIRGPETSHNVAPIGKTHFCLFIQFCALPVDLTSGCPSSHLSEYLQDPQDVKNFTVTQLSVEGNTLLI